MKNSLFDSLFSPLDKSYCDYFYFLSVIFYVLFIIAIALYLVRLFTNKKTDSRMFWEMFIICSYYFVFYFQNRLLYSMCSK